MQHQRTDHGWLLRLDAGEEIIASLQAFATAHGIVGGVITGIGAVGETELGFFVRESRSYIRRTFTGDHEILSLLGNFSVLDGVPFPHCHLILCGEDFAAHGGHLFKGLVTVTCEIHILTASRTIVRTPRPDLGFHPLAPDGA
jgi:predicted DNA-binding protein with PD1-like motif